MDSKSKSLKIKKVFVDCANSPIVSSEGSQDSIQKVNLKEVQKSVREAVNDPDENKE